MDPYAATQIIQIISLIILLFLSAFFSSAETAYVSVNRIKLQAIIDAAEGSGNDLSLSKGSAYKNPAVKRAARALYLLDNKSKLLSTILILNNVVNLSASALTTTIAMRMFGRTSLAGASVAIATGILTFVLLITGEVTPKTFATLKNETVCLTYSGILLFLVKVLTPIIIIIDGISNTLIRLFGIDPKNIHETITEYELRTIVDTSHEEGVIEKEEREMITNVVDFGDSCAKDVMIPRIDMSSVSVNATFSELKDKFFEEKYTRIPVYEDTPDNIIGLLNMKDLLFYENYEGFNIRSIMREPSFTFEYKKTSDLLHEMRKNTIPMIFVLDEYGATVGLVTMEDLLEEIVGEIRDEYDEYEADLIKKISDTEYVLDGSLKLDDINDAIGTELSSEDYDSIGGLIIEKLDHIPESNESVELENGTILTVGAMNKNHIESVTLILPEPIQTPDEPLVPEAQSTDRRDIHSHQD